MANTVTYQGPVVLQMPFCAQDVILPLGLWSDALEHLQSLGEPVSLQFYHINMLTVFTSLQG